MKCPTSLALVSFASVASAQVAAYGQCGGTGYTGSATCVAGYVCTYENAYFSQCLAGSESASTTTEATTLSTATSKASSTKVATTTTLTLTSTSPSSTGVSGGSGGYVTVDGGFFTIDGVTQYYKGTNAYWMSFLTDDADIDLVMSHLQENDLKILRTWGFNDVSSTPSTGTVWFQSLIPGESPVINTGADGLERLDYVVESAQNHDIKLVIPFVNNWDNYGGMPAYVEYYGLASQNDWYNSTEAQTQYQAYIKAVVSRYSTSTAILAWELANEPRCAGCDSSVLTDWITTTSQYIKSLDLNHLVTTGEEGFGLLTNSDGSYPYQFGEGTNFTQNLAIDTIDYGTFHLYPDSWDTGYNTETDTTWGAAWITNHGLACAQVGKACVLEEYGVTYNQCAIESVWQQAAVSATYIAADQFWQLGDDISTGLTSNDGNTIYLNSTEWTCLVTDHPVKTN